MKVHSRADLIEVTGSAVSARPGEEDSPLPVIEFSRDEPGVADTGRRNPDGYVTVTLVNADSAVFSVSTLLAALSEIQRVDVIDR